MCGYRPAFRRAALAHRDNSRRSSGIGRSEKRAQASVGQVDERRTRATVDQLMDRNLDVLDVEVTTRAR
jgi:hypothetical protein